MASQISLGALLVCILLSACRGGPSSRANDAAPRERELHLLNVSYDSTRELYSEIDQAFARSWKEKTGQTVVIRQSHGGSGKQARAVIDGLGADVVTLALGYDIDVIADRSGLLPADWRRRLPYQSSPFTSTIVFLVRSGNPKGIRDWADLVKPGVQVITPSPKTSGSARWNYMAAWGHALKRELGDLAKIEGGRGSPEVVAAEAKARELIGALYRNVPVLDSGARAATATFTSRGIGDVLVNWESEILLAASRPEGAGFEIVIPKTSILAEPSVSLVDGNADKHGVRAVAEAYLAFLFSEEAQRIGARHFFRPRSVAALATTSGGGFAAVDLFTLDAIAGSWRAAQKTHFDEGGVFDQLQLAR